MIKNSFQNEDLMIGKIALPAAIFSVLSKPFCKKIGHFWAMKL